MQHTGTCTPRNDTGNCNYSMDSDNDDDTDHSNKSVFPAVYSIQGQAYNGCRDEVHSKVPLA